MISSPGISVPGLYAAMMKLLCTHCGAERLTGAHYQSCPTVTGVLTVTHPDLRGDCRCQQCGDAFSLGDAYMMLPRDPQHPTPNYIPTCLGCAAVLLFGGGVLPGGPS